MSERTNRDSRGFTLLELMIGMAIFLVISGAVLGGMAKLQASYRTAEMYTSMHQRLRSTMELMAQEIGQAGLQASTVEGGATAGDAGVVAPYTLTNTASGAAQTFTLSAPTSGVFAVYVGQFLQVVGDANPEPIQVTQITPTYQASFGHIHTAVPAYPMGVFPDGIVSGSSTATKLAMFGEMNGSGNGLYAVEYTCPATSGGQLTRTEWNLGSSPLTASTYPLIDNVTQCYFCWPGSPAYIVNGNNLCPTGAATPDQVTLAGGSTYSIITQIGFTVTVSETATISGSSQTLSVTKSYSNIQPRNLITADKIYQAACSSSYNAGNSYVAGTTCPLPTAYASYLYGELQPDPAAVASVPW